MNHSDEQLEKELRDLRPQTPSPELTRRIGNSLAAGPREERVTAFPGTEASADATPSPWRRRWVAPLALAATLAVVGALYLFGPRTEPPTGQGPGLAVTPTAPAATEAAPDNPVQTRAERLRELRPGPDYEPVKAENTLAAAEDEGVVMVGDNRAARQVRYHFVDTVVWENPMDGSTIEVSVPREEVVLIPLDTI